ncbi:hypothetical protein CGMCC3_g6175 [Colletotrichum fructicola]|nr:uncharacterized protein CGMCC3_g6175 [Colletotrichum fructicola]KAE9577827.1 hypothetical protein CGMCC3_g6175 [Colletotrichum fructicola]
MARLISPRPRRAGYVIGKEELVGLWGVKPLTTYNLVTLIDAEPQTSRGEGV